MEDSVKALVVYGNPHESRKDDGAAPRLRSISDIDPSLGERTDEPIDEDVYGATIFSVCYDLREIIAGVHDDLGYALHVYRLFYVVLLLCGNYCMQAGLLLWIYRMVALPQVNQAQTVYKRFHLEVFVDGIFDDSLWRHYDRSYVCNICFSNFWFMYVILLLWGIHMLIELRTAQRLWRKISALPTTSSTKDIIIKVEKQDLKIVGIEREDLDQMNYIVRLTNPIRCLLYVLLLVPKMCIAMGLLFVGWIWLTATDSVTSLILNCVSLGFVVNIDELIFEGLIPETMKANIRMTNFYLPGSKQDRLFRAVMLGYLRSTLFVILVFLGTYVYMVYGQDIPFIGVFPGYGHEASCNDYWMELVMNVCKSDLQCFPKS